MALTRDNVRAFYDRFGAKQDSQAFYEDAALDELVAHADFGSARHVFEFGCGTGRFAERLLLNSLPLSATYRGIDLSETMVRITSDRLDCFGRRIDVQLSDGSLQFPLPDNSVDRIIATYVLDLLSDADIGRFVGESHRALAPGGRLCLVSLTKGETLLSRTISSLWSVVYRLRPALVGGCRPITLRHLLAFERWAIDHHQIISRYGVASEIVVATPVGK